MIETRSTDRRGTACHGTRAVTPGSVAIVNSAVPAAICKFFRTHDCTSMYLYREWASRFFKPFVLRYAQTDFLYEGRLTDCAFRALQPPAGILSRPACP